MKRLLWAAPLAILAISGPAYADPIGPIGVDVSNWTGEVDWAEVAAGDARFAFVQATEGTNYVNPSFQAQYGGAADAGLLRGAYHLAQPHESDGTAQADYFLQNGGKWLHDGRTLPGVLDLEDNPYKSKNGKNTCYDLSKKDMVAWIADFTAKYHRSTGRNAIIYTTTSWWKSCTGDSAKFGKNPLWLAHWGDSPGEVPKGWKRFTFWQSADKGPLAGGGDAFNGPNNDLRAMANPPAEVTVSGAARNRRTYTVTVTNTGPFAVTNIKITGRAYGGQRVVRAPGCTFSGTAVRCTVPELARGRKVTLTFTTKPPKRGTVGMRFKVGEVDLTLRAR